MLRLSKVEGLSAGSAGRRLDEMVKNGTLLREAVTRAGRKRTARITLLPGCDTDELTRIAEALDADREALLLRAALLMFATSVDARLLANLDAFMPLCLRSDRGVPSDGYRQELLVHLRALCTLARRSPLQNEKQAVALDQCCATLEKRWNLPEHLINAQVDQRITTFKLLSLPPLTIPGSPRGTPRDDGFDLGKMLARFRGERASLSSPLKSRFTRDTRLEQVVTGWLDDGTLQCLITNDDPVPGSVSRFVLGPDAPAHEVAAVATVLKDRGEWHLALLWWSAWAMNANRADEAFIHVIKTVLVLEDCIELPPVSTWDELSRLCAHAMALKRLKRCDFASDLQACIERLQALVTLEHRLFPQVLACATAIVQRLPEDERASGRWSRRLARIEARVTRARAEHGLQACGLGVDESATCLAKPETLDVVMRLLLQGNLQPRVESSPRDGFRGFDAMRRAEPGDVVTLASVFAGVGRPALALQLLAAHLTQLAALNGEDLACVSSVIDIARNIDPKDGAAVQAIRSILLHIRLLLHCEVAAVQELEVVDVDAVDDRPLADQEIREIEAGNDQVEILREFEAALLTCLQPGSAETADIPLIGDVDGLCHLLERMAGDPLLMAGPRRVVVMQAAAQWAATCTGPARDGVRQAWAHANGLPADGEDFASQSMEWRRALVLQLGQQLEDAAFTFEMRPFPGGEAWQRQLIVPTSVQVPVDGCLAYAAAVLRRSGRTPAGQAACWVPLLVGHVDARDTPRRARLLVLALRAIEREPKVMAQAPFSEAMAKLLADHGVLSSLLDEMPDDLPSVVFSLVLAGSGSDSALDELLHDCLKAISCSAAFASAMTRRSGAWMLDGALSCILEQPLLLQRPEVCEVLRCMATPPARSGSMKAMAMAVVMRLLREHGAIGPALVECLAMQGLEARKKSAAGVMKCIETSEGASSGMTPRKDGTTRENLETLRSLLVENIVPRRRSLHSNPPRLVTQDPLLHSTWLGAGVADAIAGEGEHLLPMLAEVHREQRKRRGNGWRESGEGLVFALQLFLRAAADQPDEVLDGLICAQGVKGTAKLKSSEWMAFAGLVASQVVLKRRPVQIETSGVPVQLARLMCAALSLEMRDPVACLRHLLEAQACKGEAEGPVGNKLFSTAWCARIRARLHTECLRRHPSVAW